MAEYADDFENGSYAGTGPASFTQEASSTTVDGGNSQFVVEYRYGEAGGAADVDVKGGNNQFVIRLDGSSGGNTITVDGGNNKFVVALEDLTGGMNLVDVKGGNNQFVVVMDYASGSAEGDVVNVSGDNNQYGIAYDYTAIGGGMGFSGESGGGPVNFASGQGGDQGGDLASALGQSPFGRLFNEVPGAAEAFGQAVATRSAADQAAGVSNPFGDIAPGQNPFSGIGQGGGQQQGGEQAAGGNPFAGGGQSGFGGGVNPFAGGSTEDGGDAGGNPFAGPGAANFFGPPTRNDDPDYVYEIKQAGQADSIEEALAGSPFGQLLELPDYTVEDLLSALDGNPVYGMNQDIA